MESAWPFDQGPRVATLTTRQVLHDGFPILRVVHYADEEDWAFTCGTTNDDADARLIAMEEALQIDPTIAEIADLPVGWGASHTHIGGPWSRYESPSA
jgi:hypothetical protein